MSSLQSLGRASPGAPALLIENVYGHTKKVRLALDAISRMHARAPGKTLKILDIGCGSGFAVTRFLGTFGDEVLGIDFYPPNIAYANAHFGTQHLSFACLDATQLRDEGKRYDVVVLSDVLEHLDEPDRVLHLVHDLILPDGRVIVTIPNGFGPFEVESYIHKMPAIGWVLDRSMAAAAHIMNRWILKGRWSDMANRQPADLPYNSGSPHVQWFTQSRFRHMVESAGFKIEDFRKLSTFSGPFSNYIFGPFAGACERNARLADMLPAAVTSAWWTELSIGPEKG
jgi:2-polyprenyl-3-methyl-5-hydroxy-6-metoxy-1,4-benzoquinol methylase